jgi:hypothetical protein
MGLSDRGDNAYVNGSGCCNTSTGNGYEVWVR